MKKKETNKNKKKKLINRKISNEELKDILNQYPENAKIEIYSRDKAFDEPIVRYDPSINTLILNLFMDVDWDKVEVH